MYKFNICFIRQGDRILLINRKKAPLMGLWNGVGGKLEPGETVLQSVLREVNEETGLELDQVEDKGVVKWTMDGKPAGGMYVYTAELPTEFHYPTPVAVDEGILDWKEISWAADLENAGIVNHVPFYINKILFDKGKYEFECIFENNILIDFKTRELVNS